MNTFLKRIFTALKKDVVLSAALTCGIVSCFFCRPAAKDIIGAIDFRVLSLLFCLMTVIAAFKSINVLDSLSQNLLRKCKTVRSIYLILCTLVFFCAAIVTNDVALLTFVPITLIVCSHANIKPLKLIVFETLAANLGSCMTPMGNPQNLFIYSFYKMTNADFFLTTLKIGIPSFFLLFGFLMAATKDVKTAKINIVSTLGPAGVEKGFSVYVYLILLIVNLLSVFHAIHYLISFAVTLVAVLIFNRKLLLKVDYTLLLTFTGFFIFTSNVASVEAVRQFFKSILNTESGTFFAGLGLSQIISNVPAALLLSSFTENAKALLAGVNIGGLGTIIASLASVISYKLYQNSNIPQDEKEPFLPTFSFYNVVFLVILVLLYLGFGLIEEML